jgi:hypothetical protein
MADFYVQAKSKDGSEFIMCKLGNRRIADAVAKKISEWDWITFSQCFPVTRIRSRTRIDKAERDIKLISKHYESKIAGAIAEAEAETTTVNFLLHGIPKDTHTELKVLAARKGTSMNQLMLDALSDSLA